MQLIFLLLKKMEFYGQVLMFIQFKTMEELLSIVKRLFLTKEGLKALVEQASLD